jgi:hypothetical protein
VILRCTKKLLASIGAKPSSVLDPDPEDWYANLLWFDRRKCLLLTHSATLFTVFEPNISVGDLRATGSLTSKLIRRELEQEHLPMQAFADVGDDGVALAATADRSVLGCMNDMAFTCEVNITRNGGLAHTDVDNLNRALRRIIYSARNFQPAMELISDRIAGPQPPQFTPSQACNSGRKSRRAFST